MAALLLTTFGSGCGATGRIESAGADPAVLAQCPRAVEAPAQLVPGPPSVERENALTVGMLAFRGAWLACRSVVIWVEDRDRKMEKGR